MIKRLILFIFLLLLLLTLFYNFGGDSADIIGPKDYVATDDGSIFRDSRISDFMDDAEEQDNIRVNPKDFLTAEVMNLTGMEAALFEGAINLWPSELAKEDEAICMPYIGVYGQFIKDDQIYVICHVGIERFYFAPKTNSLSRNGSMITYGLAVLDDTEEYQVTSFELVGDDQDEYEALVRFCGPLTDLPEKIYNGLAYSSNFPSPEEMRNFFTAVSGISFT